MYVMIEDWMVTELHLSGNELVLFALVAGHRDGYYGSLTTTAERIGVSRRLVAYVIKSLIGKGYLEEVEDNTLTNNRRRLQVVQKLHHLKESSSAKIAPQVVQKLHQSSAKFAPPYNNTKIILNNNKCDNAREDNYQENGGSSEAEPDPTTLHPKKKEKRKVAQKEKSEAARLFTPPTEAEVAAYIAEKGWQVNAAHWHAYYTANGWKGGRSPMKDWRAAVKTWQYNDIAKKQTKNYERKNKIL
jgi:hypothetical protein